MAQRDDMREVQRELRELRQRVSARPIIVKEGGGASAVEYRVIAIIGGNAAQIGNNIEGIQYTQTLATLTQAYDPDVDTVYPAGLGYGVLFVDGVRQPNNVLVRHNYFGVPWAVLGASLVQPAGTETLTYDPGGGNPAVSMTAHLFDWI